MKPIQTLAAALIAAAIAVPASSQTAQPAPASGAEPTFLILGTIHFEGSASDLMSTSIPDILSEKRQKEMEEVAAALARFRPTKIAVEAPVESTKTPERYAAYLRGEAKLTGDEMDQIAFRLAKKLGHSRIYPADTRLDMDFQGVIDAAGKNGQQPLFGQAMEIGKSFMAETNKRIATGSVGGLLRFVNSPEMIAESHKPYMFMAQIGTAADPKGAEVLAGWYKRNLLIYGNLVRLADSPGDHVLLVIGAGHAKLLRDYIAASPNLRLEDAAAYLPTSP
jgi:hypothetical protein